LCGENCENDKNEEFEKCRFCNDVDFCSTAVNVGAMAAHRPPGNDPIKIEFFVVYKTLQKVIQWTPLHRIHLGQAIIDPINQIILIRE
jgi:hypothetical protein